MEATSHCAPKAERPSGPAYSRPAARKGRRRRLRRPGGLPGRRPGPRGAGAASRVGQGAAPRLSAPGRRGWVGDGSVHLPAGRPAQCGRGGEEARRMPPSMARLLAQMAGCRAHGHFKSPTVSIEGRWPAQRPRSAAQESIEVEGIILQRIVRSCLPLPACHVCIWRITPLGFRGPPAGAPRAEWPRDRSGTRTRAVKRAQRPLSTGPAPSIALPSCAHQAATPCMDARGGSIELNHHPTLLLLLLLLLACTRNCSAARDTGPSSKLHLSQRGLQLARPGVAARAFGRPR
jgi:hypothetical protein